MSAESCRSSWIILAPEKSCMMIEPVTMGPIPRCMIEPEAPAIIARNDEKTSRVVSDSP